MIVWIVVAVQGKFNMYIKINPFVSSRVYEKEHFGFIADEFKHFYYLLTDYTADFWNLILVQNSGKQIREYAKRINKENELKQFLTELKFRNLIDIDADLEFSGYKFLKSVVEYDNEESFSEFHNNLRRLLVKKNFWETLILQLSYNCNLNCRHCFNNKSANYGELNYDIARRAIDEGYELGITTVGITGGECSIHKDFLKIARYVRKKHLSLIFLTNGQKFFDDDKLIKEVIALYPEQVQFSVYSMIPEVHDYITKKNGSLEKTLKVIEQMRENNIKIVINTPVLSLNKDSYKSVKLYAKSIGAVFDESCFFINNKNNKNEYACLSYEEIREYYSKIIKEKSTNRKCMQKDDSLVCNDAGTMLISIAPNLDITPCNDFKYVLGNYRTDSLSYIKNNSIPKFRAEFIKKNLKECFKNDYCKYCSYCPNHAMFDTNFMGRSESLCRDAKAYYEAVKEAKILKPFS